MLNLSKNFYTPNEIADMLGVSSVNIRRLVKLGKLKGVKFGNRYLISRETLQTALYGLDATDTPAKENPKPEQPQNNEFEINVMPPIVDL